jgi:NAD(P)-dependent dehydrogenase (short-subunit alcohol dehydrogenase family)
MAEIQRVAIVTGAAGGIGRAMTRALLAAGSRSPALIEIVSRWRRSRRVRVNKQKRPNC